MKITVDELKNKPVTFPRLMKNPDTGSVAIQTSAERLVVIHSEKTNIGHVITTGIPYWKPFSGSVLIEG